VSQQEFLFLNKKQRRNEFENTENDFEKKILQIRHDGGGSNKPLEISA
jgi:hypothetical protein